MCLQSLQTAIPLAYHCGHWSGIRIVEVSSWKKPMDLGTYVQGILGSWVPRAWCRRDISILEGRGPLALWAFHKEQLEDGQAAAFKKQD